MLQQEMPLFVQGSDAGEEVTYKLELVIFEYDIVPYFELEGV